MSDTEVSPSERIARVAVAAAQADPDGAKFAVVVIAYPVAGVGATVNVGSNITSGARDILNVIKAAAYVVQHKAIIL